MMKKKIPTLPSKSNFLGLEKQFSSFDNSLVVVLPCPFERTTSYGKGTAKGPLAILNASHYVEFFDEETHKEVCFERGIATIKPLAFDKLSPKKSIENACEYIKLLIEEGKFVVTLGGEHTISLSPVKAHFDFYKDLSILQFDAHSDLRMEYENSMYSHASFAARVSEFTTSITQVGIRAQCKKEYEYIKKKEINTFYAHLIKKKGLTGTTQEILESLEKNVYITFDVDFLDPSIMPSEPGGFFWDETLALLREIIKNHNLVGFDVVELSPRKDFPFSDFLTAKLIYKILNYRF